jgi:hypothetical protein
MDSQQAKTEAELQELIGKKEEVISSDGETEEKKPKNWFKILTFALGGVALILAGVLTTILIINAQQDCITECPDCGDENTGTASRGEGPYLADGFLAVPEWGVRFKLPTDMTDFGFSVQPNSLTSSFGTYVIGMTAVFTKDLDEEAHGRYYATIDHCALITVSRTTSKMTDVVGPAAIVPSGDYSYVIYDFNAHGGCVDTGEGLMSIAYYERVASRLIEAFSKPENLHAGFTGAE